MLALGTSFPFTLDVHLDAATLTLSFGLTLLAVIVATLVPGLQAMRVAPASVLRADSTSAGGSKIVERVQAAFVVGQLASATLLIAGVVSAAVTARQILDFDIGVRSPETLVAIERRSSATSTDTGGPGLLLDRVRESPSVIGAVDAYQVPAGGSLLSTRVRRVDQARAATSTNVNVVSAGFFDGVGARMLRGREFTSTDTKASPRVAVLSRSAAAHLFPGVDAIGRHLVDGDSTRRLMIVGIAPDILYDPTRPDDQRVIYLAASQSAGGRRIVLARIRPPVASSVRAIAGATSATGLTTSVHSVDELLRDSTSSLRAIFALLRAAAVLAVGLALAGVYGMVAYSARRRQREIGVRIALGASSMGVIVVFGRSVAMSAGVAIVLSALAWPIAGRILPDTMRASSSTQWVALGIAAVVLAVAAVSASLVATWRPSHVDPMRALRAE